MVYHKLVMFSNSWNLIGQINSPWSPLHQYTVNVLDFAAGLSFMDLWSTLMCGICFSQYSYTNRYTSLMILMDFIICRHFRLWEILPLQYTREKLQYKMSELNLPIMSMHFFCIFQILILVQMSNMLILSHFA